MSGAPTSGKHLEQSRGRHSAEKLRGPDQSDISAPVAKAGRERYAKARQALLDIRILRSLSQVCTSGSDADCSGASAIERGVRISGTVRRATPMRLSAIP